MAINVKLTAGSSKDVNSYSIVEYPGLTTTGNFFLQDVSDNSWYIFDSATGSYIELNTSLENLINNNQQIQINNFFLLIDTLLDSTAISYGYNSIDNVISYYNSGITAWREEAIAFNTWRDNTIDLMYDNIYSYTADGITLPSLSGFTGQAGYSSLSLGTPSRPQLFS